MESHGEYDENEETMWDHVHGGDLPLKDVVEARTEEVTYMKGRKEYLVSSSR